MFTASFLKSPGCNNHYVLKTYSKSKLVISFPSYLGIPRFGVVVFAGGDGLEIIIFLKVVLNLSFWISSFGIG